MKYFKLTYYLLFICIVAVSCTADDSITPDPTNEAVRVQLTIQFPGTTTRGTRGSGTVPGTDPGIPAERNIDNIHLYIFEKSGTSYVLKEEARGILISEPDTEGKRFVTGILFEKYANPIKLVALANLNTKELNFNNLPGKGIDLSDFYKKLIYMRTPNAPQWPTDGDNKLPMWGESAELSAPQAGINKANLSLTRAVAGVSVLINNGAGIDGKKFFKISQIEVCQYNDRGYCTPGSNTNTPNVPTGANRVTTPLQYINPQTGNTPYACENRIYIPEQENINAIANQKIFLKLTAAISDTETKEFRIDFKKNGKGETFEVLRNNMYVFNITSVNLEVNATLSYTVTGWEKIDIDVPAFGEE